MGQFDEASVYFNKAFELKNDPNTRVELEETNLLNKYVIQVKEHIEKKEFKEALRKINSILEHSDADLPLIESKIQLLCFTGEIDKAE